jgi:hypothetical protein
LGRHRWVIERTHAWFAGFGRLRIRFERRLDTHVALLKRAAAIICSRFVDHLCLRVILQAHRRHAPRKVDLLNRIAQCFSFSGMP